MKARTKPAVVQAPARAQRRRTWRLGHAGLGLLLASCSSPGWTLDVPARALIEITPTAAWSTPLPPGTYTAPFRARASSTPTSSDQPVFLMIPGAGTFDLVSLDLDLALPLPAPGTVPVNCALERRTGSIILRGRGEANGKRVTGEFELTLKDDVRRRLREAFGSPPSINDAVLFLAHDLTPEDLVAYRTARAATGLKLAIAWAARRTPHTDVEALVAAGLNYSDADLLRLQQRGGKLQTPLSWHAAGRKLTIDEVLFCRNWGLRPERDQAWHAAGYRLTLAELQYAKNWGLDPQQAEEWKQTGRQLTLQQLQWVKNWGIRPSRAKAWQQVDRILTLEELQYTKNWGITAAQAKTWKDVGRDLSIPELKFAKNWGITATTAQDWQRAGHELTLAELQYAKNHGLRAGTAADFQKLGFAFSLEQLAALKRTGVTPKFAERFVQEGKPLPTYAELLERRRSGR